MSLRKMKAAVDRAGAATVRSEGRGERRRRPAWSPGPGGRGPRRARWQHTLDLPALRAVPRLDSRETRKWTPFSWRLERQPPAMGARVCSLLEENNIKPATMQ
ncbi:uncharacterized protein LOC134369837 isoform X2 [Cynocephalus volans]|uniref:uncharacterized protein LOC134369837 isoform X2 n=1 Tax=Cynocephalus volans TaxID=110931 RepID=UPI002FC96A89